MHMHKQPDQGFSHLVSRISARRKGNSDGIRFVRQRSICQRTDISARIEGLVDRMSITCRSSTSTGMYWF